jgi:type IV fimbrial biogenesis protein FimT
MCGKTRRGPDRSTSRLSKDVAGFTLIEMMVAIAVLAIMVAIALPSFSQLLATNRLTAQANELVASLQVARSEAIRRNARVVLCPSTDGIACSAATTTWTKWIVKVVTTSEVLRVNDVNSATTLLASNRITANGNGVTFRADGLARDATSSLLVANLSVCMKNTRLAQNRRLIAIAGGSRVSVSNDADSSCGTPANE